MRTQKVQSEKVYYPQEHIHCGCPKGAGTTGTVWLGDGGNLAGRTTPPRQHSWLPALVPAAQEARRSVRTVGPDWDMGSLALP